MLLLRSSSVDDTHTIAAAIAGVARPGDVIILSGEMGAGKTAFAQGFGRALGVEERVHFPGPTRDVFGVFRLAGHAERQPVDAAAVPVHQHPKGLVVAAPCAGDGGRVVQLHLFH